MRENVTRPELMTRLGVEYWANLPLEIIEHRIGLANESDRLYYALIRCSFCFPHASPFALRPRLRSGGFTAWVAQLHERIGKRRVVMPGELNGEFADLDEEGRPRPLRPRDLELITAMNQGNVGRALRANRIQGLLREGFPFYPVAKPSLDPSDLPPDPEHLSTDISIAGMHVSTDMLPADPEARERAVQRLAALGTAFNSELRELRTRYRQAARDACTDMGILIDKERRLKNKEKNSPPTPSLATSNATPLAADEPEPAPELWHALLFAADRAGLRYARGQLEALQRRWAQFPIKEREAAIEGIKKRLATKEYGRGFDPTLKRYIFEELWTAPLWSDPQGRKGPSRAEKTRAAFEAAEEQLRKEAAHGGE